MDEYIIKDDDDDNPTFESVLRDLKEAFEAKGMIPGQVKEISVEGFTSKEEMEERLGELMGSSKKGKRMVEYIMNDPDHEFDNVVKWAEEATDIALAQPFLAETCIAIGRHALEQNSLPPFIVTGIEDGLSRMKDSFGEDFEHPPWIENEDNLRALVYGVFHLRITNTVFKTLMNV